MNSLQVPADAHYVHRKLTTRDSNQHAEALAQWDQTYDQLSAGPFEGNLVDMWFGGIQVFRETTNRSVSQHGASWQDAYVIGVPLASKGNGLFSRQLLPPDAIFTFSDQEFSLRTPEEFDVVGIAVPHAMFSEFAGLHAEPDLLQLFSQPCVLLPPKAQLEELRTCLESIFDPANFEPKLLRYPQIQNTMRSAIIGHLLEVLQFATQAPKPPPSFKSRCYVVDQAVEFALAHADDPVTVADLCTQTNVSRRMLNYCFQDVLDTNPVQYLRAIRLNGVRRDLRSGDGSNTSVRDIACKWGFWHLSRFAGEYRTMFGELPSDTLRTACPQASVA